MSGTVLTLDKMMAAYDQAWHFPQEEHFYLCHPDQLAQLREQFSEERWGTCPTIRAHSMMERGKVLEIKHNVDPAWQWHWQRNPQR